MIVASANAADWKQLFNGKNLQGWEPIGDGKWTVWRDGTLVGQRTADLRTMLTPGGPITTPQQFRSWVHQQAWLYTTRNDYEEFDLTLDYWTRAGGNSGVSLRDPSRAKWGVSSPPDQTRTPSKLGYEIQINNGYPDPHPTGSIYGLINAPEGLHVEDAWNTMEISSRRNKITVKVNGRVAAEHAGDPKRPTFGPIGLQLHDQFSIVMFRNIRIREIGRAGAR